jgi:hypothetical protein
MKTSNFLRARWDYIAGGLACGLGGVLLVGLPAVVVSVLWYSLHRWLGRQGLEEPGLAAWVWSHGIGFVEGTLPPFTLFVMLVIGPLALGFAYGWCIVLPKNWTGSGDGE